ncbi:MAG: hypothetical protein AAF992_10785 [Bacteroidota bacterium]
MKLLFFFCLTILILSGCSSPTPQRLFGTWQIEQFLVDGMDRTRKATLRYEPIQWGSAIRFTETGLFSTNQHEEGAWRLSPNGNLFLIPAAENDTLRWKVTFGTDLLILENRTKRITLTRTEEMPKIKKKAPNLTTNLPGTWYFFRWTNQHDTIFYPANKKEAVWLTFEYGGDYQSGEGKFQTFAGHWQLDQNRVQLSELDRRLKQNWQVHLVSDTLFVEPASDTTEWFQAQLIRRD